MEETMKSGVGEAGLAGDVAAAITPAATRPAQQLERIRPSVFIFLGGTGQQVGVNLKARLMNTYGLGYRDKIALLSFDSTEEPFGAVVNEGLVRLEPGSEFFNIGQVPIGRIKQNIDRHPAIRDRIGTQIDRLPSVLRGNGMKMIRPAAVVAYHWHYQLIQQELSKAIWRLAGRDVVGTQVVDQQQGMNIYIVGSLVGGTGSGLFLDMAYHVRSLLSELGMQSEYCTITGIGVLAQAFRDINGRNLYANGGAALKELAHLMLNERFRARYPNGKIVDQYEAPFNLFYVLDGVDERGRTWSGIQEVAAMAADGLFLQMASQIGKRGENAFDNVDEVLIGRTLEGEATFLSSFGLGYLEFDAPQVANLLTQWYVLEQADTYWLRPEEDEAVSLTVQQRLQSLDSTQLGPVLRLDPETAGEMYVDLHMPTWLLDKRHDTIASEAAQYTRAYGRVRVVDDMSAQINRNAQAIVEREKAAWDEWLTLMLSAPDFSVPMAVATIRQAQNDLTAHLTANRGRMADFDDEIVNLMNTLDQAEKNLVQAGDSLIIGRSGRVRHALSEYFQAAELLFERQLQQAELRGLLNVWASLAQHLSVRGRTLATFGDRLVALRDHLAKESVAQMRRLQTSGGSRISLADEDYIRRLYRRFRPNRSSLKMPTDPVQDLADLLTLDTSQLQATVLRQLELAFTSVRSMTIEDVLSERSGEMSPRARRKQLFELATPSWSIDHTRLPDGGAGLERLEILGVTDDKATLFKDDMARISTHDPHRVIAYVMVAGAAPSALQQYEHYRQQLERMRGVLPVHVLPEFMTEVNQGQLAFALGSIFKLIQSEGAHFYYHPADSLEERVRLGQGLANAIDAICTQESLIREIMDRVDSQIAHLGLQRSIEILSEYFTTVPDGKTKLDSIARELKRQVREYSEELQEIREFSGSLQG
jgi:hypothetical protein